ncbi:hypothetical protein FM120_00685 [Sphingobacterium faecium PCAi_F2.5]|nr:hypothetical protein FM120_00685 [Sphingobacterium faecium PCAi_F2.5]
MNKRNHMEEEIKQIPIKVIPWTFFLEDFLMPCFQKKYMLFL